MGRSLALYELYLHSKIFTNVATDASPSRYTAAVKTHSRFDVTGARTPKTVTAKYEAANIFAVAV